MSTNIVAQTPSGVNPPFPLLAPPDPTEAVVRWAAQTDLRYSELLYVIREYATTHPATTDWKRAVLAAAERLAATERADEQRARNEYRRTMSSYSQPRTGWCRQCRRYGCGHTRKGGR